MVSTDKKLETKRILIYLIITFGITCLYSMTVIYPLVKTEEMIVQPAVAQLLIAVVMFFPAIGVFLTRLITKEGFQNTWLHPHIKGNVRIYLLAYFGPGVLTFIGAILYFVIFPSHFDPECGYLLTTLEASGATEETLPVSLPVLMLIQSIQALVLGPIMNFITCFGEEWGWRGYLLPKMSEKLPAIPMLSVNGVIWGLWHAPLTVIGHNYGVDYPGFPFAGIGAMCVFCIVMGIFLSYVAMKSKSCIPAVLGHGAINSIAAIGIYFTKDGGNPFVGPAPTGIIGCSPFIVMAVLICIFYFKREGKVNR